MKKLSLFALKELVSFSSLLVDEDPSDDRSDDEDNVDEVDGIVVSI